MHLYLLRHGIAEPPRPGRPDHERRLTEVGVHQMRLQAAAFAAAGLGVDRLFCSPYTRARQTADLVGEALGATPEEQSLLQCGCSFDDAVELLGRYEGLQRVLLVGHQPDLGQLVYAFTGCQVVVHTGTLAAIDVARLQPRGGTLAGLYDPGVMTHLGARLGDVTKYG